MAGAQIDDHDSGTPRASKKKLEAGAYSLANSKQTSEPLLVRVLLARRINNVLGGPLVGPWDVDSLTDEMIEAILSLETVGEYSRSMQKVDAIFADWRADYARKQC